MKSFSSLSAESQGIVRGMVEYCLRHHLCMGMGEGLRSHHFHHEKYEKEPFVLELEKFVVGSPAPTEPTELIKEVPKCPLCGYSLLRDNGMDFVYCINGCYKEAYEY